MTKLVVSNSLLVQINYASYSDTFRIGATHKTRKLSKANVSGLSPSFCSNMISEASVVRSKSGRRNEEEQLAPRRFFVGGQLSYPWKVGLI